MPSTGVLVILAIIPAIVLMIYIYVKDKVEKEPIGLLVGLFFLGALTTLPAAFGENAMIESFLSSMSPNSVGYNFLLYFFIVALCEEGVKYLALTLITWKNRNFNYTFDAIVYAVTVSLGFATLENILYVLDIGTYETAFWRGILSVPGHAIDAVFMGFFYGKAKYSQCMGDKAGKNANLFLSLLVPILIHGFYDFSLSLQSEFDGSIVIFFGFVIVTTIAAMINVHISSKKSTPMAGMGVPFYQFPSYPYNYYSQTPYQQPVQQPYQQPFQQPYQHPYQQNYQQNSGSYFTPNGYTQVNTFTTSYGQQTTPPPQNGQSYTSYPQQGYTGYNSPQGYGSYDPNGYPQPSDGQNNNQN